LTLLFKRSSSVLHRNSKLYGPNNALDTSNPSSCWNSDSNECHTFQVQFHRNVRVHQIKFTCQGGFVPQKVLVNNGQLLDLKDNNQTQEFILDTNPCHTLTLTLRESADFYGRITIYSIEVWGWEEVGIKEDN
jgi:hypothetical protein